MTTIESILAKESDNRQQIYLYREGVFYKAYERSAYLFVTRVKPFRAKKKTVKAGACASVCSSAATTGGRTVFSTVITGNSSCIKRKHHPKKRPE